MSLLKRKQFWVDAPLQLQILGYALILVTGSLLLVCFSMLRGLEHASAQSRQIFHSLEWVRQTVSAPLLISSSLAILATAVVTLLWSHRFAGPLRVLSAGISRLRQLNFAAPTKVRTTDAHQELVREFNEMQEHLRAVLADERRKAHAGAGELRHAAAKLHGDEKKRLEAAAHELEKLGEAFKL